MTRTNEAPPEAVVTRQRAYVRAESDPSLEVMMVRWFDDPPRVFATLEEAEDYIGELQEAWIEVRRKRQVLDRAPVDLARCTKTLERIARALPEGDLHDHFNVAAFACAEGIDMVKDYIIDLLKKEVP